LKRPRKGVSRLSPAWLHMAMAWRAAADPACISATCSPESAGRFKIVKDLSLATEYPAIDRAEARLAVAGHWPPATGHCIEE